MSVALKRIYDKPGRDDGYRVLVDKLWPRGIAKRDARLDEWLKEIAPSDQLRRWFHDHPNRWGEFRRAYLRELKPWRSALRPLARRARRETVTLLYASRDDRHNNAEVLRQYLNMLGASR